MLNKEITDKLYAAFGSDTGIVFGIKERAIVEEIIKFTSDQIFKRIPKPNEFTISQIEYFIHQTQKQDLKLDKGNIWRNPIFPNSNWRATTVELMEHYGIKTVL